jgi:hypothetical protein
MTERSGRPEPGGRAKALVTAARASRVWPHGHCDFLAPHSVFRILFQNAEIPVWARPRINA